MKWSFAQSMFALLFLGPKMLFAEPPDALMGIPFSHCRSSDRAKQVPFQSDTPKGFVGPHNDFDVSKNGKLAVCGEWGWSFWDIGTGTRESKARTRSRVTESVAISPDGKLVAVGGDNVRHFRVPPRDDDEFEPLPSELKLYDAASGRLLHVFGGHISFIHRVRFTPDGKYLVSLANDNILRVWTVADRKPLVKCCFTAKNPLRNEWQDHEDGPGDKAKIEVIHEQIIEEVGDFAISPNGNTVAVSTVTRKIFFVETVTGRLLRQLTCKKIARSTAVVYSPDGSLVAVGGPSEKRNVEIRERVFAPRDGVVEIWTANGDECVAVLEKHSSNILCLAISPDNQCIVSEQRLGRRACLGNQNGQAEIPPTTCN